MGSSVGRHRPALHYFSVKLATNLRKLSGGSKSPPEAGTIWGRTTSQSMGAPAAKGEPTP